MRHLHFDLSNELDIKLQSLPSGVEIIIFFLLFSSCLISTAVIQQTV